MSDPGSSWLQFRNRNSDLIDDAGNMLGRYYSKDLLGSELARQHYLLPGQTRQFGRLEEAFYLAIVINPNRICRRDPWQPRHRHDCTAHDDDELGTGRQANLTNWDHMTFWRAKQIRIRRETVLRLRHADRVMPVSGFLELGELVPNLLVRDNIFCTIN